MNIFNFAVLKFDYNKSVLIEFHLLVMLKQLLFLWRGSSVG